MSEQLRVLIPMQDRLDGDLLIAALTELVDRAEVTASSQLGTVEWSTMVIRVQPAGGLPGLDQLPEWMPVLTLEVQADR